MANLSNVISKIEAFNFNYIISEEQVVTDEGAYNVPLEKNNNVRYLYKDSNEYGSRTELEIKKIKMINDCMEIMSEIYTYASGLDASFDYRFKKYESIKEQYEQAIFNDAPPDGGTDDGVDGDSCEDSEMTIDVDDLSEQMKDVEL